MASLFAAEQELAGELRVAEIDDLMEQLLDLGVGGDAGLVVRVGAGLGDGKLLRAADEITELREDAVLEIDAVGCALRRSFDTVPERLSALPAPMTLIADAGLSDAAFNFFPDERRACAC